MNLYWNICFYNEVSNACHNFLSFLQIRFIDNTDPAGIDHQIAQLGPELASTLVIVISKVCMEVIFFAAVVLVVTNHSSKHVANMFPVPILLRVEALQKQEMVYWKYKKHSVKLAWILQNRFSSQVLVSAFI